MELVAHKPFLYHHNRFSASRQWRIAQTFQKIFLVSKVLFVSLCQLSIKLYVISPKVWENLGENQRKHIEPLSPEAVPGLSYVFGRCSMPEVSKVSKKTLPRRKVPRFARREWETIAFGYREHGAASPLRAPSKRLKGRRPVNFFDGEPGTPPPGGVPGRKDRRRSMS